MKISVAMATYNGAAFIREQLASILEQSQRVDEVIICDDQSSDDTVTVVKQFIEEHELNNCWSIEKNEKNLGYASNFMKALRGTTGDIVFFCDQDDIWLPDRVERMTKILCENPQVMMIGSEFEPFSQSEQSTKVPAWELNSFQADGSLEKVEFNSHTVFIGCQGCTMAMKRSFLEQIDQYWYTGWAHDEYVWKLALSMDGLYIYHAATLKRRLHEGNVTMHTDHRISKRLRYLDELLLSHEATLRFIEEHGADEKKCKLMKKQIKGTKLRIAELREKKIWNVIPLSLIYSDCYHKKRAIPVELMMVLRQ